MFDPIQESVLQFVRDAASCLRERRRERGEIYQMIGGGPYEASPPGEYAQGLRQRLALAELIVDGAECLLKTAKKLARKSGIPRWRIFLASH